jgi:hypothetical protein
MFGWPKVVIRAKDGSWPGSISPPKSPKAGLGGRAARREGQLAGPVPNVHSRVRCLSELGDHSAAKLERLQIVFLPSVGNLYLRPLAAQEYSFSAAAGSSRRP